MCERPSPSLTTAPSSLARAWNSRRALRAAAGALLAALGCGGGSSGFGTMGMPGIPSPTRVGANLVFGDGQLNGTIISFPATRIPLTVDVEGVSHPFILDTGASETTVRSTVYNALIADGRGQLNNLPITTVAGPGFATVARVRTLTVGGQTVTDPVVMMIGDPLRDQLLDSISGEVNHTNDGLLGGNFLREFMVTIDYPRGTLHLQRYTSAVIVDEFKRVGFELGPASAASAHSYAVGVVYDNTDAAAKNLSPGDELVSVDGRALDGLDSVAADNLLNGNVGSTKAIG